MRAYFRHPATGQIKSSSSDVTTRFLKSRGYEPHQTPAEAETLKGADLEAALDDAGLPKSGSADEKRARLAEHLAAPPPGGDFDTPTDTSQTDNPA